MMCQKIRRWAALLLISCMGFSAAMPMEVLAATKPINSVSVKVSSKLEAGGKLPDIEIGGSASDRGVSVSASGSRYTVSAAEWLDKADKEITAGDEPRMKVTLTPDDVSDYYFLAS